MDDVRGVAAVAAAALVVAGCGALREAGDRIERPSPEASTSEASVDPSEPLTTLADYESQTVEWGDCEEFDPPEGAATDGFECAYVQVPLDYDDPASGSVDLAVNRRPARDQSVGAILVNPGGPGGSGVDYAFYDTFIISSAVVEQYDLVGFDPRGVARSEGVDCLSDRELDEYLAGDLTPDDAAEELAASQRIARLAEGCSTQRPLAEQMGTVDAARDMDVLRAVLGEDELNFLGKSYGTQLGWVYADLFPENVGRMVLDGAVDPLPEEVPGQLLVEQIGGFETAARAFVEDCLTREDCPLSGDVDRGMTQIAAFVEQLDRRPLPTGDDERPLTQGLAVYGVFAPLYQVDAWRLLRSGLAEAFEAGTAETLLLLADLYAEREADGSYRGNGIEALSAVNCLDLPPRAERPEVDNARLEAELREAAPVFGTFFDVEYDACEQWPFDGAGLPEADAPGAAPILVIGTTRDPATPYAWATRLAGALESAVLLTYDGDGHTAYLTTGSECVDDVVDAYLIEGEVPRDGLRCEADYE